MTIVSYPLGRPHAAADRGGDCRARDMARGINVHGPWRFGAPTDLRVSNGIIRLTVGPAGTEPTLAVEQYTGGVVSGDVYNDVYADVYGGIASPRGWAPMGSLIIDSLSASVVLAGARLELVNPESVVVRLKAPLIGDAFVTLYRGFRAVVVRHGTTRAPLVTTTRRIRWSGPPALAGTAYPDRVQEDAPTVEGFARFVAGLDASTTNAGAFSVSGPAVHNARFGAGIATPKRRNSAAQLHAQLGSRSRGRIDLTAVAV